MHGARMESGMGSTSVFQASANIVEAQDASWLLYFIMALLSEQIRIIRQILDSNSSRYNCKC